MIDLEHLRSWVGRTSSADERIGPVPAAAMAATLDLTLPVGLGTPLPPLWHWLHFLPLARRSELGPDGHPQRGGFLPPVPLPRRMWAGGRLRFDRALRVGDEATRRSTVVDVSHKRGRSGELVFVLVRHEIRIGDAVAITEDQDIVYRADPRNDAGAGSGTAAAPGGSGADRASPAPAAAADGPGAQWEREITPDEVLLFRYSALTFNGHRIHYDHRYVTEVEHYPGLVVHGPLIATLLLDALARERPAAQVRDYSFRALRPAFVGAPLWLCGRIDAQQRIARLWARNDAGQLAMEAQAGIAEDSNDD